MTAIKNVFKKAFDFSSRATRAEYWWWMLCSSLVSIVWMILILTYRCSDTTLGLIAIPFILFGLITFIPGLSLLVRRLHDVDKSAWHLLWCLLPYVGGIVVLVMTLLPSKPDNKYGPMIND